MKKIIFADYRHKGHRLNLLFKLIFEMPFNELELYVNLPRVTYGSDEWSIHSPIIKDVAINWLSVCDKVPDDDEISNWLKDSISQAKQIGADVLIFPWADKLAEHIIKYKKSDNLPHIHMLLGRCPPGIMEENDYVDQFHTIDYVKPLENKSKILNISIEKLCATFDPITNIKFASKNVRWVNDPVDNPSHLSKKDARNRLGLEKNSKYALHIGHLSDRKKTSDIIKSWPNIYKKTGVKLIVAGEIDQTMKNRGALKKKLLMSLDDGIFCKLGVLENCDFADFIKASDIVLCIYNAGTYMSSGVAGLAAVNGIPILSDGNSYINRLVISEGLGLVGDINDLKVFEIINELIILKTKRFPYNKSNYSNFYNQFFLDCLPKKSCNKYHKS